jgi:endoglucanase
MTRPCDDFINNESGDQLILIDTNQAQSIPVDTPVIFDLPDFEFDDQMIRMRALDDLAGCASILIMLERLVISRSKANVYGVFTRAEEVGLYGARLLASSGMLPRDTIIISIESSSVIPGVSQGKGPVIRTGDASSTFDFQAEYFLRSAAIRLKNKNGRFDTQRQLMSGGTCEATAFSSMGYKSTGIAFPLGNYHNAATTIRDPKGNVAAEYIALSDYLGGVELAYETSLGSTCSSDSKNKGWELGPVPLDIKQRLQSSFQP